MIFMRKDRVRSPNNPSKIRGFFERIGRIFFGEYVSMKVLITGATGLIGRATMLRLLSEGGHELTAVSRDPSRAANQLGAEVHIVGWDQEDELVSALDGCDLVLHLAGAPVADRRWTKAIRHVIWESRVGTTKRLIQSIGRCRQVPKVLIQASAVGIYGGEGRPVEETSELGEGFLAELGRAWEAAGAAASEFGTRVIAARFGVVLAHYGAFETMARVYHWRCGARIGSGRQGMPWVHLDDAVEMLLWAYNTPAVTGPLNVVSPAPLTQGQFHNALVRHVGAQWSPPIPASVLRWVLGARAELITEGAFVTPKKACDLGYKHRFATLADALTSLMRPLSHEQLSIEYTQTPEIRAGKKSQYVLKAETIVPSSIDEVAPWFETPANLTLMTPPFMAFEIQTEEPMGVDAEISYRIRLFGVPMRWTSRIPVFEPGVRFVDTQVRGPYRLWWHEHRFSAVDGGTRILDIVHYRVPVPVLGRLANRLWVGPTLLRIFGFRYHTMTQRFASPATQTLRNSA